MFEIEYLYQSNHWVTTGRFASTKEDAFKTVDAMTKMLYKPEDLRVVEITRTVVDR